MGIEVKNLSFAYGANKVLEDISFSVADGEFLSILGSNGVGKSTLFRCILGLLDKHSGQVLINGQDNRSLTPKQLALLVAYIPQSCAPTFNFSVEEVVMMGTTNAMGSFAMPGKKEREKVEWALGKIGISHLSRRCFHHLSGGERQLVIIARALAQDAGILMLDEPTASLDFGNQILVLDQARALADEGYTVIQTTHHPEHSFIFSDRILALKAGRVLADGEPKTVLTRETVSKLYGLEVRMAGLYEDKVRVYTPGSVLKNADFE